MDGNFLERAARSVTGSAEETTDSSQRVDMATFDRDAAIHEYGDRIRPGLALRPNAPAAVTP